MKKVVKEVAEGTYKRIADPLYAGVAAEVGFWLLLSLVPATILLAQILHIFTLSAEAAQNLLGVYLSGEVYNIIAPLLEFNPLKSVTVIFILLALWAGSSAVFALMRIINRAYGISLKTENSVAHIIKERLRSMLMTLLLLVTMIFALYILVYGEVLVHTALAYSNDFMGNTYTFSEVWYGVRWVIAFVLFFLTVFSIYYFLPRSGVAYKECFAETKIATAKNVFAVWLKNRRHEYLRAMPGSVFAAAAMLIVTRIYTLFVRDVADFNINVLYGGLSSIVVLLFWFYVMAFILIVGIHVNAAYAEYALQSKNEKEKN